VPSGGISDSTLYRWKAKYDGLEVSELKRLKHLEDENRRLKQIVADLTLDNTALKDVLAKNGNARCTPNYSCLSEQAVQLLQAAGVSPDQACPFHCALSGPPCGATRATEAATSLGCGSTTLWVPTIRDTVAQGVW
jgi:hypothetical protein